MLAPQSDNEQVQGCGRTQETQAATQTKGQELLLRALTDRPDEEFLERTLVETIAGCEIERAQTVEFRRRHLRHVANHVANKESIRAESLKPDGQQLKRRCLGTECLR
ncbi:translation factor pelota [Mycolicibacterium brisbanense]|uniref:Translation factor pelota n=1 Tax=Mycolicibacterium brisbanense TaxID=146020 RepID=A0A117I7B8_9MYCO|nr:translation factor pelota [Mycolicibacterium brisbanense]